MRDQEFEGSSVDESASESGAEDTTAHADADGLLGDEIAYSASSTTKYILVGVIVVLSAVLVYGLTQGSAGAADGGVVAQEAGGGAEGGACQGGACSDCETAGAEGGPIVSGTFAEEDHQWIDVNVSGDYFDPNVIVASAGMPIKINFGEGSGCMSEVQFYDFPVREDLTSGGAVVELPALEPGEYAFACGAEAVFGLVVVQ